MQAIRDLRVQDSTSLKNVNRALPSKSSKGIPHGGFKNCIHQLAIASAKQLLKEAEGVSHQEVVLMTVKDLLRIARL